MKRLLVVDMSAAVAQQTSYLIPQCFAAFPFALLFFGRFDLIGLWAGNREFYGYNEKALWPAS